MNINNIKNTTRYVLILLITFVLIYSNQSIATPFTETVPNNNGPIPNTYPNVGGTLIVLKGINGNIYYQFVNPSTQFEGFQFTGTPAAFRGNPFQLGPTQDLDCGITDCATYFGGSIVEGYARLTARDGDACPGNFDVNDVYFELNGIRVASFTGVPAISPSMIAVERTNRTGTTSIGTEDCFRNQGSSETSTAWFDLATVPGLLNDIFVNESTTPRVFDDDGSSNRGDNYWFFKDGNDATGTPEVAPGITIVKTSDVSSYAAVGDIINYTFTVRNIGSVPLTNVVLTDDFVSGTINCPSPPYAGNPASDLSLRTGQTFQCTAQHIVTQANIDNDRVFINTAEVTATPTEGTIGSVSGTLTIPGPDLIPSLDITKEASKTVDAVFGDVIIYTYTVENDGFITIDNVAVSDVHNGDANLSAVSNETITVNSNGLSNDATPNGSIDSLAPGDTATFTATYKINQNDINSGVAITNTATATGTPKRDVLVNPTAQESVALIPRTASMTITKVPSINANANVGDVITYTYTINNTGNTTITSLNVTDAHNGEGPLSAINCLNSILPPSSSTTCSANYTVLQDDINKGVAITNTASASGSSPSGTSLNNETANASVAITTPTPSLSITKSANDTTDVVAGQIITYTYVVSNTGNVTFNNVSVDDSSHSGIGANVVPSNEVLANNSGLSIDTTANNGVIDELAPNDSVTLTANYTVTQDDIDLGSNITNTAFANGTPQTGTGFIPPSSTVVVSPEIQNGLIDIQKIASAPTTADGSDPFLSDPNGDTITYTITTRNMGNVTLDDVVVIDNLLSVTATDCANTSNNDNFNNDGNDSLDVGESVVCTVVYDLTITDIDNGARPNTATVNALDQNSAIVTDSTTVSSGIQQETSISLLKVASTPTTNEGASTTLVDAGDTIDYTFTVQNTGNVTLTDVSVTDTSLSLVIDCGDATATNPNEISTLAAGASAVCNATYTITTTDIDGGNAGTPPFSILPSGDLEINNQATATGTPVNATLSSPNAMANATATIKREAALAFEKSVSPINDVNNDNTDNIGDTVTYTFTITNTGSTTLNEVTITEVAFGGSGTPLTIGNETLLTSGGSSVDSSPANDGIWDGLLAGEAITFNATYALTQPDINAGEISNTARGTASAPAGTGLDNPSAESSVIFPIKPEPSFTLDKSTPDITNVDAGSVTYTYDIENTGNVSINNISITDIHNGNGIAPLPSNSTITLNTNGLSSDAGTDTSIDVLAPGDTARFTATYIITQEDIDIGNDISNDATANGTPEGGVLVPAEDSVSIDLADPAPLLTIAKSANNTTNVVAGQSILYTYVATNTGNITVDNVFVSDSHNGLGTAPTPANEALSNPTDPVTSVNSTANDGIIDSLAPGDVATFTATYIITQTDIDRGSDVANTATPNGTPKAGTFAIPLPTSTVNVDLADQTRLMTFAKAVTGVADNGDSISNNLGDVLTYTVTATNTGNTTVTNVVVTDNRISPNTASCASIPPVAPGGTVAAINRCVLTGTYTVDQDDVNAGNINNVASITTAEISGIPNAVVDTPVVSNPTMNVTKVINNNADEDGSGTITLNDTLTYTITATNNGTVVLNNVVVTDSKTSPNSFTCPVLVLGDTCVLTGTYQVDQDDVNAGAVVNNATANSDNSPEFTATNNAPITRNPAIAVIKTSSVAGGGAVNDVITFTFRVKNTGDVTLTNPVVTDNDVDGGPTFAVSPITLLPGEEGTATATYAIDQNDINAGQFSNQATVNATPPVGSTLTPAQSDDDSFTGSDPTVTPLTQDPQISIIKTAVISGSGTGLLSEQITYTFTVNNEGNVPLTGIVINDTRIGVVNLTVPDLAVGSASVQVSPATPYTIIQDDINDGSISNQATVTADSVVGPASATDLSDDNSALEDQPTITALTQTPGIAIVKTASVGGTGILNDPITYTFVVTNTGNVPLTSVTIADSRIDVDSLAVPNIAVGTSQTVTAIYNIKQSDIDEGGINNQATATGTSPNDTVVDDLSDNNSTTENDSTDITLSQNPSIALIKTTSGLKDDNLDGVIGGVNDLINYVFNVTNTGDVTLDNIVITDLEVANITCLEDSIAPGDITICTGNPYTITQTDIDNGSVSNVAAVTADDPQNNPISDNSDDNSNAGNDPTITSVPQTGSIGVVKTADVLVGTGVLNDVITYTFEVENTGTVTLTDPVINDALTGSVDLIVNPTTLLPGEVGTAQATYTIQQKDIDAGRVLNQATVTATDPSNNSLNDTSDNNSNDEDEPTIFSLNTNPAVILLKTSVVNGTGAVNDTITYTLTAENTGDVTLTDVVVNDALTGSVDVPIAPDTLAPGEIGSVTLTYTIQQQDLDNGGVSNSATVSASPPPFPDGTAASTVNDTSDETDPTENDPTVTPLIQTPNIAIVKTNSALTDTNLDEETGGKGDEINYVFTVTNTGDVTMDNLSVTDPKVPNITCLLDILAPGVMTTCTGDAYIITQPDIDAGFVSNQATVTADDPNDVEYTDISDDNSTSENDPTVTAVPQDAGIAIVKTGAVTTGTGGVDDIITYTFTVTNTGTVTLRDLSVSDALTGSVNIPVSPNVLAPTEVGTAIATYTIQQVDVDASQVVNQASATGTGPIPGNEIVNDTSDDNSPTENDPTIFGLNPVPAIALLKTSTVAGGSNVGDIVTYTFTVTNTGDMTLSNILVNDPLTQSVNLTVSPATLAPGASGIAQATYAIDQDDLNNGSVSNSATVSANAPNFPNGTPRPPVEDTSDENDVNGNDPTITPLIQEPAISIVKTASIGGNGLLNDVITYTFVVTNEGNIPLTNVNINDTRIGVSNLSVPNLAVGASETVTQDYLIQQLDLDISNITNQATVSADSVAGTVDDLSDNNSPTENQATITYLSPSSGITVLKISDPLVDSNNDGITGGEDDVITYRFIVQNTGDVTLRDITITDTNAVMAGGPIGTLIPGATDVMTFSASHIILQTEIDVQEVVNQANIQAVLPNGQLIINTSDDPNIGPGFNDPTVTTVPARKVEPVPTLSEWMLSVLALLLLSIGLAQNRSPIRSKVGI